MKPFQNIDFLVRDWPEIDHEKSVAENEVMFEDYLSKIMGPRKFDDLKVKS